MAGTSVSKITVISGLSGAGKSTAVATFEDAGYFCIDNMPPQMLPRVIELFSLEGSRVEKVALVFDVRGGEYFESLDGALAELDARGLHSEILFLEADEETLVSRFQATRRAHPLGGEEGVRADIRRERELLSGLRARADVVLNTTQLNVHQLRRRLRETMLAGELREDMLLTFVSFGYKYGVPTEADTILDARFLPNPHWVDSLRPLSGVDDEVRRYVVERPETHGFLERVCGLLRYLIPLYLAEQKTQVVVGVGCTGGRHRSVALVEELAALLGKDEHVVTGVRHRDVDRQS